MNEKSLCKIKNNAFKKIEEQLPIIESISTPLSYYGGRESLQISYISDIHLLHHIKDDVSINSFINATIRNLYNSMGNKGSIDKQLIIFGGDISSDPELTIFFYTKFVQYENYVHFKKAKEKLYDTKVQKAFIDIKKQSLEDKINRITRHIDKIKTLKLPGFNLDAFTRYKNRYQKDCSWVLAINAYKDTAGYKNKNNPGISEKYLDLIASKLDLLENIRSEYDKYISYYEKTKGKILKIENFYKKSLEELAFKDIYEGPSLLTKRMDVYAVLGNHEFIGFDSIKEAVSYYKPRLNALGITLLYNSRHEFKIKDKTCVIFGGTGFAKYNPNYNADTLVCCKNFSREKEIEETGLFEKAYSEARKANGDCFICVSHYPVWDCLSAIDSDTFYFYGHNHQNYYKRNEKEILYADNQIGYENNTIAFKTMNTGIELNPYFALKDGLYETSVKDYLQFYRHIGEYIGEGVLLNQRCKNNNM